MLLLVTIGCTSTPGAELSAASPSAELRSTDWLTYDCASGGVVRARCVGPDAAQVEARGRLHAMARAIAASGARYAGGGLEWWAKGSGAGASGLLLAQRGDALPGEPLDTCSQR